MAMNSHDHDIDGNIRKFTIDQFELALTTLRRTRNYNGAVYEIFERYHEEETSKAIMIHLVMTTPLLNLADKDLVLMTWGLLPGFTDIESIGERRRQYIRASGYNKSDDKLPRIERNNLTTEQLDKLAENLMKKENPAYEKIAKQHHDIALDPHNTEQFILSARQEWLDVHGYAKLPKASFLSDYSTIDNLSLRNLHFVAREDILADIYQKYFNTDNPVQVQALCGMAGVGKSTIALEYAYRYRAIYGLIWWIDASSETTLVNSCTKFLERKGINYEQTNGPTAIINLFLGIIAEEPEHLLIFDNADMFFDNPSTYDDLLGYIRLPKSHILITTRIASDCDWSVIHHVKPFDLKFSIKYLVDKSGKPEDEYTQVLAERLDNLPLALTYAGAYIKHHTDYKGYLDLWNRESLELWDDEDGNYADRTVRQAFNITLNKLKENQSDKDTKELLELLNLCASFEAEYLPVDAYISYLHTLPDDRQKLRESVLAKETVGRIIQHPTDGRYYDTRFIVLDDKTYEERWVDGPDQGEIVPPDLDRNETSQLISKLEGVLTRNRLVRKITRYSLAEYDNGKFRMHPLLREIIRDQMYDKDDPNAPSSEPFYSMIAEVLKRSGDQDAASNATINHLKQRLKVMEKDILNPPFFPITFRKNGQMASGKLDIDSFTFYDMIFDELLEFGDAELIKQYLAVRTVIEEAIISLDDEFPCATELRACQEEFYNKLAKRLGRILVVQRYNSPSEIRATGKQYSFFFAKQSITPELVGIPNDPALTLPVVVLDDPATAIEELTEIMRDDTTRWTCIALPPEYNDPEEFSLRLTAYMTNMV